MFDFSTFEVLKLAANAFLFRFRSVYSILRLQRDSITHQTVKHLNGFLLCAWPNKSKIKQRTFFKLFIHQIRKYKLKRNFRVKYFKETELFSEFKLT